MIGYLDLPSGISGDMFLGCLVDAGWTIEQLRATLAALKLPAEEWSVDAKHVMTGSLFATRVEVHVREGHSRAPGHHGHHHDHDHHHHHAHRNLHDVRAIIEASDLPTAVKDRSVAVFARLANAEAHVHGTTVEHIHFHEVGALDAIVDIVGSVAGIHALGIERLYASALPMGGGWTNSEHGKIPLPAPATMALLAAAGAPTCEAPGDGELVTPTGAALVCELARFEKPPMQLRRVASGAGQRDTAWPNIARLWLGADPHAVVPAATDVVVQIETNIDDMNPQFYGPLMEKLLGVGAVDVWMVPVQMKKNRPGVLLAVLAHQSAEAKITDLILRGTTTLGVRVHAVDKHGAVREIREVTTEFGVVPVKLKHWDGRTIGAMPEYEDCRRLADLKDVPVRVVYEAALAAAHAAFLKS